MLTRQGWLVLACGVAMVFGGRALGIIELYVAGAAIAVLVVSALVYVRFVHLRLELGRDIVPTKVHAGGVTRVELRATNLGKRRTPVLKLRDPVAGTKGANLQLAPLRHGERARAAYRLPTAKRGLVAVGPLTVQVADPFALAQITTKAAPVVELTVYPQVWDIAAMADTGTMDPHAGAEHPNTLGRQGEDFYALRPYVVGDDLRRVHWPSTARHDELMVRQDELPWQGRTTVVLDVRRIAHADDTFEHAVSAAASVVLASARQRDLVRLVTTDGTDSGFAAGHLHIEAIMEYLATADTTESGSMRTALDRLGRSSSGGGLVIVVGRVLPVELRGLAHLPRRFGTVSVVTFATEHVEVAARSGMRVVAAEDAASFAAAWDQLHRSPRARVMSTR